MALPTNLDWQDIDSTRMVAGAYDVLTQLMFLRFKNNRVWSYDVPHDIFTGLMSAESAGRFLGTDVDGTYESREVADD